MRDLFLLDPDLIFLNHGSFGAVPKRVFDAQCRWLMEMERNPVAFLARRSAALLADARAQLGQAMGAQVEEIVFLPNATTGVSLVAHSLALAPGDEILTTDLEYGACDAAWEHVCAQRGARYRRIAIPLPYEPDSVVARLRAAVGPRTRLICLSHITSATALILPVSEVCAMARAQGVLTLIDGAHAPGQIDLNLQSVGADFYVGNCHKWLCAPKGAAFLYARGEHQAMLDAPVISWGYAPHAAEDLSAQAFLGKTPFERRMQWQGTRDVSAWLSVPEALRFLAEHDWPSVRARCHALAEEASEALTRRHGLQPISGPQHWAQMVAIPVPPQNAPALQQRLLNESGIEVPVTTHGDQVFVRVSVQAYNSPEDIEALLNAPALR